jgi:hypothetical protein
MEHGPCHSLLLGSLIGRFGVHVQNTSNKINLEVFCTKRGPLSMLQQTAKEGLPVGRDFPEVRSASEIQRD